MVSNSVFRNVFSVDKEATLDVSAVKRPRTSNNSSDETRSWIGEVGARERSGWKEEKEERETEDEEKKNKNMKVGTEVERQSG